MLEESSNIFEVYEQEIGELTSHINEELKAAEELFGADKIKEAIKIAVEQNKRKWSYISVCKICSPSVCCSP